ncbi:arginine N-succinyltransferase [Pseudomonas sp. 2957]|jgi:arginine N-succinyltransferase|uniref:Arginine N-succinyltransferase n=1 Tax=Pseudomonas siliginis TaxID=2842346 RepID=A0ABY5CK52_9PSED|nr:MULTISPECIES: arginine N-succinyltransferase [Pseudomonas]AMT88491.1 arginine N-succinyltransferase [Pseudomonas koreensis]MBB4057738.1 arginine N-succinyltransferase [Pseudomonas koreensis]MBV4468943.1 arginine N-succinyltransferase [Pseudomonas siliginis]MDR6946481.1 arginine N-succinyltransferase [Pseudomonas sp. 2957]TSB52586.1 arginine N-succinyltransferase [Pseudomonas sp. ef1]
MIVRPVKVSDLPALMTLVEQAGPGFTTLPANEDRLAHRVRWAQRAFAEQVERADADYLFVLEDDEQRVVGVSAMAGAVGLREPWYNYRLGVTVSSAPDLGIQRQIPTLFLNNELTGQSELCSLFLRHDQRNGSNGRLLSLGRLLFVAEFPHLFGEKMIAELRGSADENGCSPFWDSLGRHFFQMDFTHADHLSGLGNKAFIAELMPRQPLYTCLLTEQAQAAIGQTHPNTQPALKILQAEGFTHKGYIDIFDGGPVIEAPIRSIRTVRDSLELTLSLGTPDEQAPLWLIHNRRLENCRITVAPGRLVGNSLVVDRLTAKRLQLQPGNSVRAVLLPHQQQHAVAA